MNVLQEAEGLINGDRQKQYGSPSVAYERLAEMWSGYLDTYVSAEDAINMMILLKVSRAKDIYHRDSYVDICGYAGIAERLHEESTPPPLPFPEWTPLDVTRWADNEERVAWELALATARTEYEE